MSIDLTSTGWAALGCLVGIVLISAALLWAAWRRGMQASNSSQDSARQPGPSPTRAWNHEEDQLAELARRAEELRSQQQSREEKPK